MQLLSDLIEKPAVHEKMQSALAQWHAPHAAEQIAEAMLVGPGSWSRRRLSTRIAARPLHRAPGLWSTEGKTEGLRASASRPLADSAPKLLPGRRCWQGGALEPARCHSGEALASWGRRRQSELAQRVSRATVIRRDEPLAKHTTLRVGGPADLYVEPASEQDLAAVLA